MAPAKKPALADHPAYSDERFRCQTYHDVAVICLVVPVEASEECISALTDSLERSDGILDTYPMIARLTPSRGGKGMLRRTTEGSGIYPNHYPNDRSSVIVVFESGKRSPQSIERHATGFMFKHRVKFGLVPSEEPAGPTCESFTAKVQPVGTASMDRVPSDWKSQPGFIFPLRQRYTLPYNLAASVDADTNEVKILGYHVENLDERKIEFRFDADVHLIKAAETLRGYFGKAIEIVNIPPKIHADLKAILFFDKLDPTPAKNFQTQAESAAKTFAGFPFTPDSLFGLPVHKIGGDHYIVDIPPDKDAEKLTKEIQERLAAAFKTQSQEIPPGPYHCVIPPMAGKTLVLKDFETVLKNGIFADLRKAYDGTSKSVSLKELAKQKADAKVAETAKRIAIRNLATAVADKVQDIAVVMRQVIHSRKGDIDGCINLQFGSDGVVNVDVQNCRKRYGRPGNDLRIKVTLAPWFGEKGIGKATLMNLANAPADALPGCKADFISLHTAALKALNPLELIDKILG